MRIDRLYLRGFRNYAEAEVRLAPGINLFLGDNAQGKTNLLEAISYLSAGHSFRTRREAELLGFGQDFCELLADVEDAERQRQLRVLLFAGARKRQIFLSGVKKRTFGEVSDTLNSVLFCPEDLSILRGGSGERRRWIDQALCQLFVGYDRALSEYSRCIEHKSRILKDRFRDPSLTELLPEFNEQICRYGAEVVRYRATFLRFLGEYGEKYHREFSGQRETMELQYHTVSTVEDPFAEAETVYGCLRAHLEAHWQAELESAQCLTGPHKDDFEVILEGRSLKSYGSQGQTRTAAISLKLAERAYFRQETGEEPVLLLDDVLSELDAGRQDFVLNRLGDGQVLITCCEMDRLTQTGKMFHVKQGTVAEM